MHHNGIVGYQRILHRGRCATMSSQRTTEMTMILTYLDGEVLPLLSPPPLSLNIISRQSSGGLLLRWGTDR